MGHEDLFCVLVHDAQQGDLKAKEALLNYLEPELVRMTWFIRIPQEDSLQSLRVAVLELIS
jgi:hypothetical protein